MQNEKTWTLLGKIESLIEELSQNQNLKEFSLEGKRILLSFFDGEFGAINARCNHMGAPLAQGRLKPDGCIECPWHYWQFDHKTGEAKNRSYEPLASCGGHVSNFPLLIQGDSLFIDLIAESPRVKPQYNPMMAVAREPQRAGGKLRVLGLSTTPMDKNHPRYSTSEDLIKSALQNAKKNLDIETQFISLSDLNFRHCEGFYSKSEKACTWPCSISKMDSQDEMVQVYEALVHWADVVIVGTSIRWGSASSLYYKMAERLNTVQNQITLHDKVLIKNKVTGFIITGGQDNIQSVAGQMLNFFGELGFISPPFPFVAHSLGWSSEDMEANTRYVKNSEYLHQQAYDLVSRSLDLASKLLQIDFKSSPSSSPDLGPS